MFDDLKQKKGSGTPYDALKPLGPEDIQDLKSLAPAPPSDYVHFLSEIGYGPLGDNSYMLYSCLMEPKEIYGDGADDLTGLLLFGDDFQGYCNGFMLPNCAVFTVNPTNHRIYQSAPNFSEFIRNYINELGEY